MVPEKESASLVVHTPVSKLLMPDIHDALSLVQPRTLIDQSCMVPFTIKASELGSSLTNQKSVSTKGSELAGSLGNGKREPLL